MGCNFGQCILDDILCLSNFCDVTLETPDTPADCQQDRDGSRRDSLKTSFTGKTRFSLGLLKQTFETSMGRLKKLEVAAGYVELLKEVDALRWVNLINKGTHGQRLTGKQCRMYVRTGHIR